LLFLSAVFLSLTFEAFEICNSERKRRSCRERRKEKKVRRVWMNYDNDDDGIKGGEMNRMGREEKNK